MRSVAAIEAQRLAVEAQINGLIIASPKTEMEKAEINKALTRLVEENARLLEERSEVQNAQKTQYCAYLRCFDLFEDAYEYAKMNDLSVYTMADGKIVSEYTPQ